MAYRWALTKWDLVSRVEKDGCRLGEGFRDFRDEEVVGES